MNTALQSVGNLYLAIHLQPVTQLKLTGWYQVQIVQQQKLDKWENYSYQ